MNELFANNLNGIAQHVIKEDPLSVESSEEQRHLQQQQHRYQQSLIKIPNQQNQQIRQPVKCSMFTQTEQTTSFTQTEQSNSSYSDQRQVINEHCHSPRSFPTIPKFTIDYSVS